MNETFDLVVVGSGAAGLSCALTARHLGLSVVVLEKTPWIGGSTAYSGGAVWIPNNPQQVAAGAAEPPEQALDYLRHEVGNHGSVEHWRAFLDAGPKMLRFMEENTDLHFSMRAKAPDYHPDAPGAAEGYRVLDPIDFDGRRLGPDLARLREPIAEFTVLGGMPVGRADIPHMYAMTRSARSAAHVAGILARHLGDLVRHGRSTRLVLGRAMAGRLAASALAKGIDIRTEWPVAELVMEAGAVTGVVAHRGGQARTVLAAKGVVLAGGGAPQSAELDAVLRPHKPREGHWSMSPAENEGDGVRMAMAVGARLGDGNAEPLFYAPVSLLPQKDGSTRPFPHLFLDRAKPGVIAVDGTGRRFVNEANSYHDFVRAMLGHGTGQAAQPPFWLLTDHRALRRYGLGAVPPFPGRIRPYLASGYLKRARTIAALAAAIGVEGAALEATVSGFNVAASQGADPDFGKGSTSYNRYLGDPDNRPNPCLAPLEKGPFYAIRLHPGDIGAATGVVTDPRARVLDAHGAPVSGLFACGNDANSIMGGAYPGAGITLGPALTFGYVAAHTAAGLEP